MADTDVYRQIQAGTYTPPTDNPMVNFLKSAWDEMGPFGSGAKRRLGNRSTVIDAMKRKQETGQPWEDSDWKAWQDSAMDNFDLPPGAGVGRMVEVVTPDPFIIRAFNDVDTPDMTNRLMELTGNASNWIDQAKQNKLGSLIEVIDPATGVGPGPIGYAAEWIRGMYPNFSRGINRLASDLAPDSMNSLRDESSGLYSWWNDPNIESVITTASPNPNLTATHETVHGVDVGINDVDISTLIPELNDIANLYSQYGRPFKTSSEIPQELIASLLSQARTGAGYLPPNATPDIAQTFLNLLEQVKSKFPQPVRQVTP